ncbi:gliding motility-associated C-terminal domain-containing protein [Flavobacterium sp. I3-2]|uniref:T9SS type B sorting domain-containing protein n=1 Tax=Flavobacterium sp. I3-2 TaxID=2748319 RepID=UPI0015AC66B9|nr:gliding motility-associated C-terminal domain-containing protein [Flavobacterium sp. I3-2]
MKKTTLLIIFLIISLFCLKAFASDKITNDNNLLESFKRQIAEMRAFDQCSTIFPVPFNETFNTTSTSANCWNAFNLNNDNVSWIDSQTNTYEGNRCKQLPVHNLTFGSTNDWLISPNINLDAIPGTKELKFYVKLSPHLHGNWQVDQVVKVAVSTTGGSNLANFTSTIHPGKTFQNDFYVEVKLDLVNIQTNLPLTGVINVGFHVNRNSYPLGRGVYLDDVIIDAKPTCKDITHLVSCVNQTSVDFSWNTGQNETQWEYCIVSAGLPPLPAGTTTTTASFSTTGLTADTWYTVWVRAICGPNSKSNWTPEYFKTIPSAVQANPFCGDSGAIVFQNNFGSSNTSGYGPIGCLGFTPNAIWYYFEVDTPGNLEFNIVQNTQFNVNGDPVGIPLDVDYVAFGPFNSLDQACSNIEIEYCSTCPGYLQVVDPGSVNPNFYPFGNIVDCSPSPAAIETLSIPNAQVGQIYAVLIANWDGLPGFIKLEQTNSNAPGSGSTNCDFLCEIDLGEDITVCNTASVNLSGQVDTVGDGAITSIQWFKNDILMDVNLYNTLNINVTESGTYKIVIEKDNCTQPSISDEIEVKFIDPFDATQISSPFLVCDLEPDGIQQVDFQALTNTFISTQNLANYQVTYFNTNQNAIDNLSPIDIQNYTITQSKTIYVRISTVGFTNCVTIAPIVLNFKAFEIPIVNFAYQNPICKSNHDKISPILPNDFSFGGIFSSTEGLEINAQTGEINVELSEPGDYVVKYKYTVAEPRCGESKEFETNIKITRDIDIVIQGGCFENKYLLSILDISENGVWNNLTYEWSGNGLNSTKNEFFVDKDGRYNVKVTTPEGCTQTTSIDLADVNCLIPKGISPNGDGLNDAFVLNNLEVLGLKVINRYGKEVYVFGHGYRNEWVGQDKNGNQLPSGTYFYAIQTPRELITGWIQIVREK